jgi:hypothetical protein
MIYFTLVSVRKETPQKAMNAMVAGGSNVKNFLMNSITSMRFGRKGMPLDVISKSCLSNPYLQRLLHHHPNFQISRKVNLSLGSNQLSTMPWRMRECRYSSTILNLGSRWRWLAPRPCRFTPEETAPGYSLDRRLGGPHSRSERYGEKNSLLPILGIEHIDLSLYRH